MEKSVIIEITDKPRDKASKHTVSIWQRRIPENKIQLAANHQAACIEKFIKRKSLF